MLPEGLASYPYIDCKCMYLHGELFKKNAVCMLEPYQPIFWHRMLKLDADQRLQPVNPFVVAYLKQAVTQCHLSTVTQLLFCASIYVDAFTKLGRNAPQAHIIQETNPSSPQCSLHGLSNNNVCWVFPPGGDCNCLFSFVSVDLNTSWRDALLTTYFGDGALFWVLQYIDTEGGGS